MNWYIVVKFFHIIAVIMFIGGLFAQQLVRWYAKKTDDVRMFAAINHAAGKIENILEIPGSQATLVLGVILALIGGFPIFGFLQGATQNWLLVSNILLVSGLVLVPTVKIPHGKKFEQLLQTALTQGKFSPELHTAMDDKAIKLVYLYEEVSLIAMVALMVLKPF
ncbi:MAG: DUF2269 family protein [Chloroflexi bacterium]|nr:DUF2269 family protein [Chloroflexota bacterium]